MAVLLRTFLSPLSALFGAAVAVRNWFFDVHLFKTHRVAVPVISVGNISVGGTGKTPFVEFLAASLKSGRRRVAVVSRGYGRRTHGPVTVSDGKRVLADAVSAGDEAVQVARRVNGAIVLVDERRARAAERAVVEFNASVIIADDAFQHRFLHRDFDVVMMTIGEVFKGDRLLPAGRRRESLTALRRADMVVISDCESLKQFENARAVLRKDFDGPSVGMRVEFVRFNRAGSPRYGNARKIGIRNVVAFSGIARSSRFIRMLEKSGVSVLEHLDFRDHHWYSDEDLESIHSAFESRKADAVVTTEKDAARLEGTAFTKFFSDHPVYVAEVRPRIIAGGKILESKMKNVLQGR